MKKLKRQLIADVQELDMNSKIDFFNFMVSHNIEFMENTNGVFFSIAELSDEILNKLNEKVTILQKFQIHESNSQNMLKVNEFEISNFNILEKTINNPINNPIINISNDKSEITKNTEVVVQKEVFNKNILNEYNEILKDMENRNNKMNKKNSIYIKYSVAKKKYNKQAGVQDTKKIESFYLNELVEEDYIF